MDAQEWLGDCKRNREFLTQFSDRLPGSIAKELDELQEKMELEVEAAREQQQQFVKRE